MADPAAALSRRPRTGKEIIGRFVLRTLGIVVALFVFTYLADYFLFQLRLSTKHAPFSTVTVYPLYAVPRKDQKTEFISGDPTDQQCVNALFPHMGDSPCWYLTQHTHQQINM